MEQGMGIRTHHAGDHPPCTAGLEDPPHPLIPVELTADRAAGPVHQVVDLVCITAVPAWEQGRQWEDKSNRLGDVSCRHPYI